MLNVIEKYASKRGLSAHYVITSRSVAVHVTEIKADIYLMAVFVKVERSVYRQGIGRVGSKSLDPIIAPSQYPWFSSQQSLPDSYMFEPNAS